MAKKLKITQIKSTIGCLKNQKLTMKALGIKKIRQSVLQDNTAVIRGMIGCVRHLVNVEEVGGE